MATTRRRVSDYHEVVKTNRSETNLLERAFAALGCPATPEHMFAKTAGRRWRFDWAWPDAMVAVECEGGIWRRGGGAHSHPINIMRDLEKGNAAVLLGWAVLRYTPEQMLAAVPAIVSFIQDRRKAA